MNLNCAHCGSRVGYDGCCNRECSSFLGKDKEEARIREIIEEHKELFKSLAEDLMCPGCNKVVKPPFANLGPAYHQAEGCMDCYVKIHGEE